MPNIIRQLPLTLMCRCGETLFEGVITIGHEGEILSYDFLVSQLNVTCPACMSHCQTFDDDFTRALDALEHLDG